MGRDDRRARADVSDVARAADLAGLLPQHVQFLGERPVGREQRLHAERTHDVGGRQQQRQIAEREASHREHPLGAVHERETFLRREAQRFDARIARAHAASVLEDVSLADQRERAVRERGEIPRRADRSVLWHDRSDAGVQHAGDPLDDGARAGMSRGERARAQQHHAAHDLLVDRIARARRMRANDRVLQFDHALGLDVHVRERPEAGRDPVHDLAARDHVLHQRARRRHARGDAGTDRDLIARARDRDHVFDAQRLARDGHRHRDAIPAR